MSFQQIAKLYLRGSLCTDKLKNLSEVDRNQINDVIELVEEDPMLQHCQREFCYALSRTIKNEYADLEVGKQDFRVAVLRAAVAAKFGDNCEEIYSDPRQRKKWFQTWVFNYLRQILRENRIPAIRNQVKNKLTEEYILDKIVAMIENTTTEYMVEEIKDGFNIVINTFLINLDGLEYIHSLKKMYFNKVDIDITSSNISIKRVCEPTVTQNVIPIREHNVCNEEGQNDEIEAKISLKDKGEIPMESLETIQKLRERLPDSAHCILDIYIEDSRPESYIKEYGSGAPKVAHIAEFLRVSPREVKKVVSMIKIQLQVLQLGY